MQTKHYVKKSGYWVYDSRTKTVIHQNTYPYHTSDSWVYVSCPGHILTDGDGIVEFFPEVSDDPSKDKRCFHSPKTYVGFTDTFSYCEKCGAKL